MTDRAEPAVPSLLLWLFVMIAALSATACVQRDDARNAIAPRAEAAGAVARSRVTGGNQRPEPPNFTLRTLRTGVGDGAVSSFPAGIDCGAACDAIFDASTVELTATAAAGSVFAGWSGACAGTTTTCTVQMDQAKTVTASFSPATKVLSAAPMGVDVRTKTPIVFHFNQDMNRASVQAAFTSTPAIACSWTWKEVVVAKVWSATCRPNTELSAAAYTVKIRGGAKDKLGNALGIDTILSFTTATPQALFDAGTDYGDRVETTGTDLQSEPGTFRGGCYVSHFSKDDPIVFPGQPGASHLHMFFGNTGVDAFTTSEILASSGRSTCNGGVLNRTGYWMPALLDKNNNVIKPALTGAVPNNQIPNQNIYYKTASLRNSDVFGALKPFPPGLKMIAGMATGTPGNPQKIGTYGCVGSGLGTSFHIPPCPQGGEIVLLIGFPNCWDGLNLDSDKHNTHVAYVITDKATRRNACPSTHPYPMPEFALKLHFAVDDPTGTDGWHLSSDNYAIDTGDNRGGYSLHADWMNGWNQDAVPIPDLGTAVTKSPLQLWIDHCINARQHCANGGMGTLILDGIDGSQDWGYALVKPVDAGSGKIKAEAAYGYGSFGPGFDAMCGPSPASDISIQKPIHRGRLQR